jgi:hypothetical protein
MIFCDTSAAAKLYVPEHESGAMRKLAEREDEVYVSELVRAELMGVFHRRWRERKWSRADFLTAVRQFSHDDIAGFWTWLPLDRPIVEAAGQTYTTLPAPRYSTAPQLRRDLHLRRPTVRGGKRPRTQTRRGVDALPSFLRPGQL